MRHLSSLLVTVLMVGCMNGVPAQETEAEPAQDMNWLARILGPFSPLELYSYRGEEPAWLAPSWGPLSPSVHFNGAIGDSSGDPEKLAVGHHDPTREDGTVQGLEAGLSLRLNQLEGFAVYTLYYGAEEEWEGEWEEAFLKLRDLPGGFEVRGGRMLARYGKQNAQHLHAWDFVDMPLVVGRYLGDDGLITDGGDVTWLKHNIATTYGITAGYGETKAHDHAHGEEEEEHGEEHHEEEEHHHHEELRFASGTGYGRAFAQWRRNDFNNFEIGASLALGDDAEERLIGVYGADVTYTWREKGLEPGGRSLRWTTEFMLRDVEDGTEQHDAENHEEHGEDDPHEEPERLPGGSDFGLYTQAVYAMLQQLDLGLRLDYVDGNEDLGAQERLRVSPALTAYLDPFRRTSLRGQYNYDDLAGGEEAHSFWLQLGVAWGGAEVR